MKILVADDNAQNRYLLEQLLGGNGMQCVAVGNGREGLARLRAERFDVIVSDILMPGMDGFQFCREVKADPALGRVPFVFYTATYTDPKDREFGLSLGASRFLLKPADASEILRTIREVAGAAAPARPPGPSAPDDVFLQQYNSRLIEKLEHKMVQLERANAELLKTNLALGDEVARRVTTEKTLRVTLGLLRATLDSTADGILAVDGDGRIAAINPHFFALWRVPAPAPAPVRLDALLPLLRPQAADLAAFDGLWTGGGGADGGAASATVHLADGGVLECRWRPLLADGPKGGGVWSFTDTTERRRAELAQRELQNQLFESQKMEALGVLAGGIAHDFNNLLTAILGNSTLAASELPPRHPAREFIDSINQASARAAELVRQILAFSRSQQPGRRVVDLGPVLEEAVKLLKAMLPSGIGLQVDVAAGPLPVSADPMQLHQIVLNLGANAMHAMEGHGTIFLTARAEPVAAGARAGLEPGRYVVLTVRDTGCGMDEATQRRIFEPFFTTKPVGKGTGLGLSVVLGIMKNHGGNVTVQSSPGHGARFDLYFPVAQGEEPAVAEAPATRVQPGHGERVLVVEDDFDVRAFVLALLERTGYRVSAHGSPGAALEEFRRAPGDYALALLDLSLPEMRGSELARLLRALRPTLPVVIMTGYLSADEIGRDEAALDYELLLKPCTPGTLCDAINRAIVLNA